MVYVKPNQLAKIKFWWRAPLAKNLAALSFPFLALAMQLSFWSYVQPFVWIFFYLGLLASARIGNFFTGCLATFISAALAWYFFIPLESTAFNSSLSYSISTALFILVGLLLTLFNAYLRQVEELKEKAETQLARQSLQLEAAQRPGRFGSWVWDIKNGRLQVSNEVLNIFGIPSIANSSNYEALLACVHPEDKFFLRKSFTDALVKGKSFSVNYRIIRPDGETRYVHAVAEPYFDGEDKPNEMIGTLHDITDERKSTAALIESEKKFRGLLETAFDSIIIVNEKGLIEFANQQTKLWFGYEPEELVGQLIEVLIPKRFHENHVHLRTAYVQSPTTRAMGQRTALYAVRKDGTEFPVDVSLTPYITPNGKIVTAFIRDITEQKRAENQQRFLSEVGRILSETTDYQERIQKISELLIPTLADCCLVQVEEDGVLVRRGFAPQIANHPKHLIGEITPTNRVINYSNQGLIANVTESDLRMISGTDDIFLKELKEMKFNNLIFVPLIARGRAIGIIWLASCGSRTLSENDLQLAQLIAERAGLAIDNARLYREAQRAIRMREDILAIVSHDLRNPLAVISGFNEIIATEIAEGCDSPQIIPATKAIGRSVRQMSRLINDLLDFAKIEIGSFSVYSKKCSLHEIVEEGIEQVRQHANQRKISIKTDLPESLPNVECDADRIQQVIANLVGNAIKFSKSGSTVEVEAKEKDSEIEFSVRDYGSGIAEAHLPHLFDRYWQAKDTARGGVGLGLPIAKGIVESHRGRIRIESALGKGTTVHFALPISAPKKTTESNQADLHLTAH